MTGSIGIGELMAEAYRRPVELARLTAQPETNTDAWSLQHR
jgi:hypothetical protein